jgi:diguanylate cyclase (GGDEF)-like protein
MCCVSDFVFNHLSAIFDMQHLLLLSADEAQTMLFSTVLINSERFTVTSARTCEQAYQLLLSDAGRFSGVVVNFTKSLNEITHFFSRVARLSSPIPIVLLCERGNENLIISSMKNGVKDCVIKDELTESRLLTTVSQVIEAHKFEVMNAQFQKQLEERANRDFLTGTLNRHRFTELYEYEISSARRYKRPLSVAMIDLDDFKHINDAFGHKIGDEALIALSELLKAQLRAADLIGRFGGDEFVVAMPETDFSQAQTTFKRIREALAAFNRSEQLPCPLVISIGISSSDSGYESLMERADEAMYQSKTTHKTRQKTSPPPRA